MFWLDKQSEQPIQNRETSLLTQVDIIEHEISCLKEHLFDELNLFPDSSQKRITELTLLKSSILLDLEEMRRLKPQPVIVQKSENIWTETSTYSNGISWGIKLFWPVGLAALFFPIMTAASGLLQLILSLIMAGNVVYVGCEEVRKEEVMRQQNH